MQALAIHQKLVQVHALDNVAVVTTDLEAGYVDAQLNVTIAEPVPAGHKVALMDLSAGEAVYKYGFVIGKTTQPVKAGQHIHSQNLKTQLTGNEDYQYAPSGLAQPPNEPTNSALVPTFKGFRRTNGKVGIRNEVWIINTVGCVNRTAERIASECERRFHGRADAFVALTHPFGCSQLGDDLKDTRDILAGLASHPNAGAVLILGLGCENNQLNSLVGHTRTDSARLRFFNAQQVTDEIEAGIAAVEQMLPLLEQDQRSDIPASELILGMKCGGSDAFSGITANPLVGRMSDQITNLGGTAILTETPEMFGAEQILMNRAVSAPVFSQIVTLVNDFKQYYIDHKQPIYENPSPGNKAGGLTTLEEKSLGAIQKGGQAVVTEVLNYAVPVSERGLVLLQAPGNDAVSSTALAASGAHMILFTTGRGTPLGFPVPTVKIASNPVLAANKPHWIDFNAGMVLEGVPLDECAQQLFQHCLAIASGELTQNEKNGSREIAIWKRGVTL